VRHIAFLTPHDPSGFVGVDWRQHPLVVIRSSWDYQHHPDTFLAVLEEIERQGARLENSSNIVRWNMRKTYLRDLDARGIVEEGEFSMMYSNGVHSHSGLKAPKAGDFRVQEEHESQIRLIEPELAPLAAGNAAIAALLA
jgi:hypothetical protein